jgi:predicted acetyltransferase
MTLRLRWAAENDLDVVADTRAMCYAAARDEFPRYRERIQRFNQVHPSEFLLAERKGRPVGTLTSLPFAMWIRGTAVPCQGIAFVGTIKTERRRSVGTAHRSIGGEPSIAAESSRSETNPAIATSLMHEALRRARERGDVVSALMPFRASFYEHFGYGLAERRCDWTIPLTILPHGDTAGFRYMEDADRPAVLECRQRVAEAGQCDLQRPASWWDHYFSKAAEGWIIIDRPEDSGAAQSWMYVRNEAPTTGRDTLRVVDIHYDSISALRRQLSFLATLRDQYLAVILPAPLDLPLHLMLRETQLPHRPVPHATAETRVYTRMQLRILDHLKFVNSLRTRPSSEGRASIAIHEPEGPVSKLTIESGGGRLSANATDAAPDVECDARTWASIAAGDLPATLASANGLIDVTNVRALSILNTLADGPLPFCRDYF